MSLHEVLALSLTQIVRADLKELRDLDLEGAPYGYTPFCDSRREMEGYRFWKTGYWASHLGHRKYHIRYISTTLKNQHWSATFENFVAWFDVMHMCL